jgi:hypothetical protein
LKKGLTALAMKRAYHPPEIKKYQTVEQLPREQRAAAEKLLNETKEGKQFTKNGQDERKRAG